MIIKFPSTNNLYVSGIKKGGRYITGSKSFWVSTITYDTATNILNFYARGDGGEGDLEYYANFTGLLDNDLQINGIGFITKNQNRSTNEDRLEGILVMPINGKITLQLTAYNSTVSTVLDIPSVSMSINDGGIIKKSKNISINDQGIIKNAKSIFVNDAGIIKQAK